MYQRDYLMRLIEQFGLVLGKVIFQRRNNRFAEALELLTQAMKQLLGLNSKLVRALAVKDLIALLSTQGHFDAGKGLLLSDMLKAEGEVLIDSGEEAEGKGCLIKSLELLLEMEHLPETEGFEPEIADRITSILPEVQQLRMAPRLTELLMIYYSENGQLAKAEDMLYFLLDEAPGNSEILEQGLSMFEDWLRLEADVQEAGGLSAEEIRESRDQLLKLKQNKSRAQEI